MSQRQELVNLLKAELKRRALTYRDAAEALSLSHASIKRLFASGNFTLHRLERLCDWLGLELRDVFGQLDVDHDRPTRLTLAQEQELVRDMKLLCMAHACLNRWRFADVIGTYAISEVEGRRLLSRLEALDIIKRLPHDRYRLLVAHEFQWLPHGPIELFFEQQLQADYFNHGFDGAGECRMVISAMLSRAGQESMARVLQGAAEDIHALHRQDESLPVGERRGCTVVLAARHWELRAFGSLRRSVG